MWVAFLCNDVSLGLMLFLSYRSLSILLAQCRSKDEGAAVSAVPDVAITQYTTTSSGVAL